MQYFLQKHKYLLLKFNSSFNFSSQVSYSNVIILQRVMSNSTFYIKTRKFPLFFLSPCNKGIVEFPSSRLFCRFISYSFVILICFIPLFFIISVKCSVSQFSEDLLYNESLITYFVRILLLSFNYYFLLRN